MGLSQNLRFTTVAIFLLLRISRNNDVEGHGRLMDPPSRNSCWRLGFPNPVNYNDNELFCGGYAVQWQQNDGKCGICGDAYNMPSPRSHEAGGEYGRGVITRRYTAGQVIDIEIELTANHQGYFEIYICPNNDPTVEVTQECLNKYPLYLLDTDEVRFAIPPETDKKAIFRYEVQLPPYLTCSQCVIQWTYYTGNMWGVCENGTESIGCGKPETFRNCADVSITTSTSGLPPHFVEKDLPFLLYYREASSSNDIFPLIVRSQVCMANDYYSRVAGMDKWCQVNCLRYPPNCPESICTCPDTCEPIGEFSDLEGTHAYCLDKCLSYPSSKCPRNRCRCY